jgi:hypothetical protein
MTDKNMYSGGIPKLPFTVPKFPDRVGIGWTIAVTVLLIVAIILGLLGSTTYLIYLTIASVIVIGVMVYANQPKMGPRPQHASYYGAPPPPPYYGPQQQYGPPPQQ